MARPSRLKELGASVLARATPLLPPGPRLVALSGGADSAICAWVARQEGSQSLRASFVNHEWPGSSLMAAAARRVADHLQIVLDEVTAPTGSGPSAEARAREARYAVLEERLAADEWLLVGHTADDLAETVLGNLLRGAGTGGLAGIPSRRGKLVRPLLGVTRSETRELATLLGVPWREDPANLEPEPRRNVLRREVIPDLEDRFTPALRRLLVRTARLMAADEEALAAAADRLPMEAEPGTVRLAGPLLATLPEAVAGRLVRRALREVRGPYGGSIDEVAAVLGVARGDLPSSTLAGSLRVAREGPWVTLYGSSLEEMPASVTFPLPGEAQFGAWHLSAWVERSPPVAWPLSHRRAVFDEAAARGEATVRPAGSGGRIDLRSGEKALADALAEAGVPARLRPSWPVVELGGRTLWVPWVRTAPWGWVGSTTTGYLWVSAEGGAL